MTSYGTYLLRTSTSTGFLCGDCTIPMGLFCFLCLFGSGETNTTTVFAPFGLGLTQKKKGSRQLKGRNPPFPSHGPIGVERRRGGDATPAEGSSWRSASASSDGPAPWTEVTHRPNGQARQPPRKEAEAEVREPTGPRTASLLGGRGKRWALPPVAEGSNIARGPTPRWQGPRGEGGRPPRCRSQRVARRA